MISKGWGGGWGTIFRLLGILPKITDGTNDERCTLFRVICRTLNNKKKKKKKGMITKAQGDGQWTIFRLLGILPKITDRTNGEQCTLFKMVCRNLIKKKEKKRVVITKARGRGRAPFSDFQVSFPK